MEKDTPGQIHGITYKSDGKSSTESSSENVSEKFTQRPQEDFSYEEHDQRGTFEYEKNRITPRHYFIFGFFAIFLLFYFALNPSLEEAQRARSREEALRYQEEQRRRERSPYDDAWVK